MLHLDDASLVPCWRPRTPDPDAVYGFSTRRGGVSPPPFDTLNLGRSTEDDPALVQKNRGRLLRALTLDPARVATAGQVHGDRIAEVFGPGHVPECDALMTRAPGLALAVTAADCAPVVFVAGEWVAAVHAGWRGAALRLPALAAGALARRAGMSAGALRVAVGPCIGGCCYEVGAEVARLFPAAAVTLVNSRHHLDLPTAIRVQLMDAGVAAAALYEASACTACTPEWYFSHRRDAGRTGRHWGVVARRDAESSGTQGMRGSAAV